MNFPQLRNFLLVFSIIVFCSNAGLAQVPEDKDTLRMVLVETFAGKEYIGQLVSMDDKVVVVRLEEGGLVNLPMDKVKDISFMQSTQGEEPFYYNLQATRYFFGANGFGLKQGEGYYQNNWVFINQVSYGFTDYFTMGIGMVPLFLFDGAPTPVWITPKVSFPVKKDVLSIGVGGLFGTVLASEGGATFGIGYGAATVGNRNHNVSISMGYGMSDGDWGEIPAITVSGMTRLGRKFYLVTENYFVNDVTVISFGGRSIFKGGVSMDYGLLFPAIDEVFIGIPWLGISIPFGGKG